MEITMEGRAYSLAPGSSFSDAAALACASRYPPLGAVLRGRVYALGEAIPPAGGAVSWLRITDAEGARIYARTACLLLALAACELFGGCGVYIDHSLGSALFCRVKGCEGFNERDLLALEAKMREIAGRNLPVEPLRLPSAQAASLLRDAGRPDLAGLLGGSGLFEGVRCMGVVDAYWGKLAPSTGAVGRFGLQCYPPGFLLMLPNAGAPDGVPAHHGMPRLYAAFNGEAEWERHLGISGAADLNGILRRGGGRELVRVCEARHEKRIAGIADAVLREGRRVVLVAGPSSSGKTTFSHRLAVQMMAAGTPRPLALSLDDYYLDRTISPRLPDGSYDLESADALDIRLFERQVAALLSGEEVDLARFDFKTGTGGRAGRPVRLEADRPLIIEGIHGLNERLTGFLPGGSRYRVFVSGLAQMNIDDHNRVPTTDLRLIRRIVRDSQFRNHTAEQTIGNWHSVHGAEYRNIFPHQEQADAIFSSALTYELAVLREHALPLLREIPEGAPARAEADRLATILGLFEPLGCEDEIPPTSILREFIGGCTFYTE